MSNWRGQGNNDWAEHGNKLVFDELKKYLGSAFKKITKSSHQEDTRDHIDYFLHLTNGKIIPLSLRIRSKKIWENQLKFTKDVGIHYCSVNNEYLETHNSKSILFLYGFVNTNVPQKPTELIHLHILDMQKVTKCFRDGIFKEGVDYKVSRDKDRPETQRLVAYVTVESLKDKNILLRSDNLEYFIEKLFQQQSDRSKKMASVKDAKKNRIRKYTDAKTTASKQSSGFQVASLELPKGVSSFYFKKEGMYYLDVLSYEVGKNNPMADEGYDHWERTYWAHKGVGVENKQYCCLLKNWGESCPICEYRQELERRHASEDAVKALWPKKRQIMAIIDNDDKDKGVQIFEGPYAFGLGQLIDNKIDAAREGSPVTKFYYADGGMTLAVKVKSEGFKTADGGSGKFAKPVNLEMEPRETNYDDVKVPCLDELLKKVDYKKLKEIFHKGAEDDDNDDNGDKDEVVSKVEAKDVEVEDDGNEVSIEVGNKVKHTKYGVCSVIAVSDDNLLKLKDKDGNTHRAINMSEVTLVEEGKVVEKKEEKVPDIRSLKTPKAVKKEDNEEEE